jgi:predicted transcriptional regulator
MTLTIDLTPEPSARLQKAARARGVDAPTVVRDLIEHLPEEQPDTTTLALLDAWDAEAATLTPEERAEAKAEGDALIAGLNANRALEGRAPVFP